MFKMHSKFLNLSIMATIASAFETCSFGLTASGGVSGHLGQLPDGQNRIGGGYPPSTYKISDGGIVDSSSNGCILTPQVQQFQCDMGVGPERGFTIADNGVLYHNQNPEFYACPSSDTDWNVYTTPVPGQAKCVSITLTADNCHGPSYSPSASTPEYGYAPPAATYSTPVGQGYPYDSPAPVCPVSTVYVTTTVTHSDVYHNPAPTQYVPTSSYVYQPTTSSPVYYSAPAYTSTPKAPVYKAPEYTAPKAPEYKAPVYTAPKAPEYKAPAYTAPKAPVYKAPVYTAPKAPVYKAPEHYAPPPKAPYYEPKAPYYAPKPPHYEPKAPYYAPKIPHYQPKAPYYAPKIPHYQPKAPYYAPKIPHYQPKAPYYAPKIPHYQPKAPYYAPKAPYYDPKYQVANVGDNNPHSSEKSDAVHGSSHVNVEDQPTTSNQHSNIVKHEKTGIDNKVQADSNIESKDIPENVIHAISKRRVPDSQEPRIHRLNIPSIPSIPSVPTVPKVPGSKDNKVRLVPGTPSLPTDLPNPKNGATKVLGGFRTITRPATAATGAVENLSGQ
ncbi:BgTH12-00398 [Blumeria graminis f. sp. triticale]|nr:BgTH12-00398 [Blumeria graminis f. sp. triticale]